MVDTASHWTVFGQLVIIIMIQIGGLGLAMGVMLLSDEENYFLNAGDFAGKA